MDEEFSWTLPDETAEREVSPAPAPARLRPPPGNREQILAQVGPARIAVYEMVRACVDDFERVAPWKVLYYPPQEPEAFVGILTALLELIQGIPKRVAAAMGKIPKGGAASDDEPTREDVRFMFSGIHHMVSHEVGRLGNTLAPVRERPGSVPTPDERQLLCELSADLKGKYSSSMMGAAASLIAQGLWNGVEVEPILFPEKAEEFRNTRELVDLLKEVLEAIKQLPEQVRFTELMEGWQKSTRVDQYALADLPSLRGKIAKLLKERTRRALYSGDYHQISRREVLLSERINELETLHQRTWATDHGGAQDLATTYARLVQLTTEMAAVLDVTILKALIGDKKVEGLRARVTSAKTRPAPTASTPGAGLDSLIPLLAEDDLRIFLELLLGAVMRRASLTVTMREPAAPEPPPPPAPKPVQPPKPAPTPKRVPVAPAPKAAAPPEMDEWVLPPPKPAYDPSIDTRPAMDSWRAPEPAPLPEPTMEMWTPPVSPVVPDWAQPEPEPPEADVAPRPNLRPALKMVSDLLSDLLSAGNTNLNSFKMTQRLLSKHARIPAAMFQSTHPYLKDIQDRLVPALRQITPFRGITDEAVKKLEGYCRDLRRPDLSPTDIKEDVPKKMERLVRFLEALRAAVPTL